MSNPFGDDGRNSAQVANAPAVLPARDADSLVQVLPDADARAKYAKYCSRIEKALNPDERVLVLALAMSGKPGLFALTNERTLFVFKPDAITPMRVVETPLAEIAAAQPARNGLNLHRKDTGKAVGYQMDPALGEAVVRELATLGVAQGAPTTPLPSNPHGALDVLPEKTKKLALQHIAPDEWVFLTFVGARGQSLIALADRLLIVKTGFMAGNTFGGQASTFPYREITGVDIQTHLTTAVLQVQTASFAGVSPRYWSNDRNTDPYKLPNCIPLQGKKAVAQWQANLATLRRGVAAGGFIDPRVAAAQEQRRAAALAAAPPRPPAPPAPAPRPPSAPSAAAPPPAPAGWA